MRAATACSTAKSVRTPAGGATAALTRWKRRSKLTNVPSFSSQAATGKTTSAAAAVGERNRSLQITSGQAARAARTEALSGSVASTSSPITHSAFNAPSRAAANICGIRSPGRGGTSARHASAQRVRAAGSMTFW